MKKIPTVFVRNPDDMSRVLDEWHPDCLWVRDGEGIATRKYDGTCVMLDDLGSWWARREVKKDKLIPDNFLLVSYDSATGNTVGWEPINKSSFYKAFKTVEVYPFKPGTYELCGPKINGNPEKFEMHVLISHADAQTFGTSGWPRDSEVVRALVTALGQQGWEGVVWHHPDGRMAKLKARDLR